MKKTPPPLVAQRCRRRYSRFDRPLWSLLVLGPLATCSSHDHDSGRNTIKAAAGALTASSTLQQALSGKVSMPGVGPGFFIAAAITGAMDVGDDGTASYHTPIWVPDGVNGMRPALEIGYGSEWSPGLLGPKWNIQGLSKIVRCKPTVAQDGATAPISLSGDVFCLGSDRLIRTAGSPGSGGEFRTETNPFQKIVATADATGILSFTIYETDGRISYYGRTVGSRLVTNPSPTSSPTYAYYLDRINDRYGNSVLVTYRRDREYPCCGEVQEKVPDTITWGGTNDVAGQRSVKFFYQPSNSYNPEAYQRAVNGVQIVGGQYVARLEIYGPDGLGGIPLLKTYGFFYTTPTVTGERLLHTITECDGSYVCKRSTTVDWEPGSLSYTRTDLGITDVAMPDAPVLTAPAYTGANFNYSVGIGDVYRRLLAVDLNHDGRDDIVYRQFTPNGSYSGAGYTSCAMNWVARLATSTGSYGSPIVLPVGPDEDPGCGGPYAGRSPFFPYTGDILFADADLDGYPDMFSTVGHNDYTIIIPGQNFPISPSTTGQNWYKNSRNSQLFDGTAGLNFFGNWACTVAGASPFITVGELNGDGLRRLVRPSTTAGAYCILSPTSTQPVSFPAISEATGATMLLDLDGDGNDELLRYGNSHQYEWASSTTMNDWVPSLPAPIPGNPVVQHFGDANTPPWYSPGTPASLKRWFLDLNGDGLVDVAFINSSNPTFVVGMLNAGGSFPYGTLTALPSGWLPGQDWFDGFDNVRVMDFNQDGRQDLVLVDRGTTPSGTTRSNVRVLLSNGAGGFTQQDTNIPIGDPTDGSLVAYPWEPRITSGDHGYLTTVALDVNGDGLPDFMQLEGGRLVSYVRQGNKPDMVTHISEGTGRAIDVVYAPVTDSSVYTPDLAACSNDSDARKRLSCLVTNRWLPKLITITGGEGAGSLVSATTSYSYTGGLFDRLGRGFLGFERRDIRGPGSRHTTINYAPTLTIDWGAPIYSYPWALKPLTVRVDTDTTQGPNAHHRSVRTFSYTKDTLVNGSRFSVLPLGSTTRVYDCVSDGAGGCAGAPRLLSRANDTIAYDQVLSYNAMGRPTHRATAYLNGSGATIRTDTVDTSYGAFDAGNWLMPATLVTATSTSNTVTPAETMTRTVRYTPDPNPNVYTGLLTGDAKVVDYEPSGDTSTRHNLTYDRDPRGRMRTLTSGAVWPTSTACNTSCTQTCTATCQASCAGTPDPNACSSGCLPSCGGACVTNCLATPTQTRPEGFLYEDADGVYPTTVTNALGQPTRTWRHPGYGLVVETDDPNHLAAVAFYDTFGRPVSEIAMSGASLEYGYSDTSDPIAIGGVDMTVTAAGLASRQITVHYDSFGRVTSRVVPIDSARAVAAQASYDFMGHLTRQTILTGSPSAQTSVVNTYDYAYDDLGRPLSNCHLAADAAYHCETLQYDGLTTTMTDESGRVVTHIADALGRPSIERAVLQTPTGDTTFSYGAFGLMEHEATSDGSGQTDVTYDNLGRVTQSTRKGAGTRGIAYNAFGEVVSAFKVPVSGPTTQVISYVRDALGRATSMTSDTTPVARNFYFDTNSAGQPVTNGIGKLVDVTDAQSLVNLHFDYDPNGLLQKKTWQVSNAGATETYAVQFAYDTQGRIQTLTYPTPLGWSWPLTLSYAYNPYNGATDSITNLASGMALWSASARNDLGQITTETMKMAGATVTRNTTYYWFNGLLSTQNLQGTNGNAQLSYTYQADGLLSTLTMSGVGGLWTSMFDYDNLGRLNSWQPDAGPAWVSYSYDVDGNLTQRSWSDETVNYGVGPTSRSITTTRTGQPTTTDTYQVDAWGRVWSTPAVGFGYNDADEVFNQYEYAAGRYDWINRDGLGKRVLTTYGSAGSLLTLDDWLEVNRGPTGTEERCRVRVGGSLVAEVTRTINRPWRTATFYLTDNVGSVVAEAPAGTVSARARRDPYGNLLANAATPYLPADPSGTNPDGSGRLGFGDHPRDNNWGLIDMNARFYSPRLGQFTSPDSVVVNAGDRRAYNPFAYASDNPVMFNDPSGHGWSPLDYDNGNGNTPSSGPMLPADPSNDPGKNSPGTSDSSSGAQDLTAGGVPYITNGNGSDGPKPGTGTTPGGSDPQGPQGGGSPGGEGDEGGGVITVTGDLGAQPGQGVSIDTHGTPIGTGSSSGGMCGPGPSGGSGGTSPGGDTRTHDQQVIDLIEQYRMLAREGFHAYRGPGGDAFNAWDIAREEYRYPRGHASQFPNASVLRDAEHFLLHYWLATLNGDMVWIPDAALGLPFPVDEFFMLVDHDLPYNNIVRPIGQHIFDWAPTTPSMLEWEKAGTDYGRSSDALIFWDDAPARYLTPPLGN
jgi:RHS repeat-associated protein